MPSQRFSRLRRQLLRLLRQDDLFSGASPVYEVRSVGHSGRFERTVEVHIVQAIGGWSMGMCRVSTGGTSTTTVNFVNGEVIDMPIHINSYADPKDSTRDIFISGDPSFLRVSQWAKVAIRPAVATSMVPL